MLIAANKAVSIDYTLTNDAGEVIELRCTYDPATRSGQAPDGDRKSVV